MVIAMPIGIVAISYSGMAVVYKLVVMGIGAVGKTGQLWHTQ